MMTNAVAGSILVSAYLFVLVLQLNPRMPLVSMAALRWAGAILGFYAPYVSVGLFFLLLFRELMAGRALRPAWLSVRVLVWLSAFGAGGAATITWANLEAVRGILTDTASLRMRDGAWTSITKWIQVRRWTNRSVARPPE